MQDLRVAGVIGFRGGGMCSKPALASLLYLFLSQPSPPPSHRERSGQALKCSGDVLPPSDLAQDIGQMGQLYTMWLEASH